VEYFVLEIFFYILGADSFLAAEKIIESAASSSVFFSSYFLFFLPLFLGILAISFCSISSDEQSH